MELKTSLTEPAAALMGSVLSSCSWVLPPDPRSQYPSAAVAWGGRQDWRFPLLLRRRGQIPIRKSKSPLLLNSDCSRFRAVRPSCSRIPPTFFLCSLLPMRDIPWVLRKSSWGSCVLGLVPPLSPAIESPPPVMAARPWLVSFTAGLLRCSIDCPQGGSGSGFRGCLGWVLAWFQSVLSLVAGNEHEILCSGWLGCLPFRAFFPSLQEARLSIVSWYKSVLFVCSFSCLIDIMDERNRINAFA